MTLPFHLARCELRPGAQADQLADAEAALGLMLPPEYRRLLEETDGFEGFVDRNDEVYVSFWSVSDIAELNEAYSVGKFLPGVVLLGTDGGDTGYGFTVIREVVEYVAVPLIGMSPEAVEVMGSSVQEFLDRLVA